MYALKGASGHRHAHTYAHMCVMCRVHAIDGIRLHNGKSMSAAVWIVAYITNGDFDGLILIKYHTIKHQNKCPVNRHFNLLISFFLPISRFFAQNLAQTLHFPFVYCGVRAKSIRFLLS